jgi:tetratricopeptide (TPR) repeat protein
LAAQYFADSRVGHCYSYFIWRDCKEESERFENQLASVVETLSGGKISGQDLAKQDAQSIVQLLMNLMESNDVLFVFDNADHYVNLDTLRMTASPDLLIQALVSSHSKSRIILTCRPSVEYPHSSSLSIHLEGLSLDSARRLFSERGAVCGDHEIVDAHQLTNGHAFWLDLLSIQVTKQPSITLGKLIDRIRSEKGELPEKTLNSLWATLKDRERLVLRTLAETVRPETDLEIAEYLQKQLTYQKVIKALNSLRAMNLVVVKRRPAAVDVLELHPLVRQFIRQSFSRRERTTFIEVIISAYRRFMGNHKSELSERPSLTTLQYWTQMAELDIAAGRIEEAFFILNEAAIAFGASGYSREFTRTVRLLLASIDWIVEYANYKAFDDVFNAHVETLGYLGEFAEVDKLLENYELTVAEKDTRYILYCDMKCSSKWNRGEFAEAVKWGEKGQKFKMSSHVDTGYEVEHSLALARRDAGQPELALPVFLSGRSLSEVIDPDELDESRGGAHYGNIGRCLHFMGQVDSALVCYQKSALLTEKTSGEQRVLNQGFIRRWIGELMVARGQFRLAAIFFEASRLKWEQVSPPRAAQIIAMQRQLKDQLPQSLDISEDDKERIFRDWILGRYLDA